MFLPTAILINVNFYIIDWTQANTDQLLTFLLLLFRKLPESTFTAYRVFPAWFAFYTRPLVDSRSLFQPTRSSLFCSKTESFIVVFNVNYPFPISKLGETKSICFFVLHLHEFQFLTILLLKQNKDHAMQLLQVKSTKSTKSWHCLWWRSRQIFLVYYWLWFFRYLEIVVDVDVAELL